MDKLTGRITQSDPEQTQEWLYNDKEIATPSCLPPARPKVCLHAFREAILVPLLDVCTLDTAKASQKLLFCQVWICMVLNKKTSWYRGVGGEKTWMDRETGTHTHGEPQRMKKWKDQMCFTYSELRKHWEGEEDLLQGSRTGVQIQFLVLFMMLPQSDKKKSAKN